MAFGVNCLSWCKHISSPSLLFFGIQDPGELLLLWFLAAISWRNDDTITPVYCHPESAGAIHHWKVNFLISTANDWIYSPISQNDPELTGSILRNKEYYVNEFSTAVTWRGGVFIAIMGFGGVFIVYSLFHPGSCSSSSSTALQPTTCLTWEYYEVVMPGFYRRTLPTASFAAFAPPEQHRSNPETGAKNVIILRHFITSIRKWIFHPPRKWLPCTKRSPWLFWLWGIRGSSWLACERKPQIFAISIISTIRFDLRQIVKWNRFQWINYQHVPSIEVSKWVSSPAQHTDSSPATKSNKPSPHVWPSNEK